MLQPQKTTSRNCIRFIWMLIFLGRFRVREVPNLGSTMQTISEAELVLIAMSKAVKRLTITETYDGRYRISATVSHRDSDLDLVTFRKKHREWVSLDRLIRHIKDRYGAIPSIVLCLYTSTPESST